MALLAGCGSEALRTEHSTQGLEGANRYIVVLGDKVNSHMRAPEIADNHGVALDHVYAHTIRGFSFRGSYQAARRIADLFDVAYIEDDQVATIINNPVQPTARPGGGGGGGQTTPWGITRVGGGISGASGSAWIIDTGIDLDHADLNVDVGRSANFVSKGKNSPDDGNGHGTHVAGTIGAIDNNIDVIGVAAGATVVAVRVLDNSGSGTYSGVIAGVDYVAANAGSGDVANMSLGGPVSNALDDAVEAAAQGGVKFALAAGNEGSHASNSSPARANGGNIYTVSAIASNDCLTSWSNYGNPPVDYAAPGSSILSTKKGGGTTTLSGTSMASPHVAGLLLLGNVRSDGNACNDPDGNPDPIAHH
jgi:subtilisin family serine protease